MSKNKVQTKILTTTKAHLNRHFSPELRILEKLSTKGKELKTQ